jgi:hypothetical protein
MIEQLGMKAMNDSGTHIEANMKGSSLGQQAYIWTLHYQNDISWFLARNSLHLAFNTIYSPAWELCRVCDGVVGFPSGDSCVLLTAPKVWDAFSS